MRSLSSAAMVVAAFILLTVTTPTIAGPSPLWSTADLRAFSDVVVTGEVEEVRTGWDAEVGTIYTYVTVAVESILKGEVDDARLVVKQLGGEFNGLGLSVHDQATFRVGEHVLLFLETRPRDQSFYTSALWQGKWLVSTSASGARVATQDIQAEALRVDPQPYRLLGPYRYLEMPSVDVQTGGQPGLPGGGLPQIAAAAARWNAAGARFQFNPGSLTIPPRCMSQQVGTGRVTVSFMDPCGEISNSGGVLAIAGSYYFQGGGGTLNGQSFHRASEGFVINNDSELALTYLTTPGCFEDIQTHELGHVLGLDHSADTAAVMFPTLSNSCSAGGRPLGQNDINGLIAIYGRSDGLSRPAAAPQNVQVAFNGTASITISWSAVSLATAYRLDLGAGHATGAPVLLSGTVANGPVTVPIPPGVTGAFHVIVTSINAAGAGPPSAQRNFTISATGGDACSSAPARVTNVTGGISGGIARLAWQASPGATSYVLQAGSSPGASDHVPPTGVGNVLGVQAPVPPGFATYVRVFARNACGTSAGVDYLVQ